MCARPGQYTYPGMVRWRAPIVAIAVLAFVARDGIAQVGEIGAAAGGACIDSIGRLGPTAPNFCSELFARPEVGQARASFTLTSPSTPFGVTVTRNGEPRYHLTISIDGLPTPQSLGKFSTYIAWSTTLSLDSTRMLGEVRNGRTDLGIVVGSQFRIIVTAESSASVTARAGRIVLRGTSPDTRLLAHRDLTQVFGGGAPAGAILGKSASDGMTWDMPPVDPIAALMPTMPGVEPRVMPWRAGVASRVDTLPPVKSREIRWLHDGDSTSIAVRMVSRSLDGERFTGYGYDGELPGPLVVVHQHDRVTVHFRNETDIPTTVHWHGVRLDNGSDGAAGVTQESVQPGDSFTYRLRFPDVGVFWYHAHDREDAAQPLGMFGNIIVLASGAALTDSTQLPQPAIGVDREEVIAIGDILIDSSGPAPFGTGGPTHALMGRFGNRMLVNGEYRPHWSFRRGDVTRFAITNVSTARPFNLSFGTSRLKVVGTDVGNFVRESWAESVPIAPAERYVVDVQFAAPGDYALTNRIEAMGHMTGAIYAEVDTLALIHVSARALDPRHFAAYNVLHYDSTARHDVQHYRRYFDKPIAKRLVLSMRAQNLPLPISPMLNAISIPVDWNDGMGMMNWALTSHEVTWILRDMESSAENMDIDWKFTQGEVVKVLIANDATSPHAMAHAIHLHGQRFLVLSRNGVPNSHLAWKDTALIPAGETAILLLDLANPGRWLLHCHVAEHMESGMMMPIVVNPVSDLLQHKPRTH